MFGSLFAIRVVMATVGIALLGAAMWVNRSGDTPALRLFSVFIGVVGTLAVADAIAAGNITALSVVWLITTLTIPCIFTWFVIEYYGLPHLASPVRKVVFVTPAVLAFLGGTVLIVSPSMSGSMTGGGPTGPSLPALLGIAPLAEQIGLYYASGVMLGGMALLTQTITEYEYLDRRLGVALSFIALWPWTPYVLTPGIANQIPIDVIIGLNATGYTLSLAAVGFAVTRGGILDAAPAAGTLGPAMVLAELDAAVIVVDRNQQVVKLNQAAAETFGLDPDIVSATPLSECIGTDLDPLQTADTVELTVLNGTRYFEVSVTPLRDRFGRQPGQAIVLTDVTPERVRSQRLSVLNRVLRHNLRNKITSIQGRAELIADSDHEYSNSAETILSSAEELMSAGERARQVEQMMAATANHDERVNLANLANNVVDEYRTAYPDATLSVDLDESLTLSVDAHILSTVLDNLVENALIHNDAPTPVVTVSARVTDAGVRLSVVDNGPGVPEHERAVIEAGDEDALQHGSGLGLWAVKWGVVRLGGDLSFSDKDPHGTAVTIDLPMEPDAELITSTGIEAGAD